MKALIHLPCVAASFLSTTNYIRAYAAGPCKEKRARCNQESIVETRSDDQSLNLSPSRRGIFTAEGTGNPYEISCSAHADFRLQVAMRSSRGRDSGKGGRLEIGNRACSNTKNFGMDQGERRTSSRMEETRRIQWSVTHLPKA